jgi:CheY-like chemotaxis protein
VSEPSPILIVDDERHVRSALTRVLRRMGFETVEAASAEEALDAIAARPLACALVDLRMPGMGGMELVRRTRASTPGLPVVVVTGHGDADDATRCAQLGVREFVMKPWNNAELQLAILRVLHEHPDDAPAPRDGPAHPETLRIAARVADALRMGPLPERFAPPLGFACGDLWGGAGALGRGIALLGRVDPELGARFLHLASAELGQDVPLDGAVGLLGPERTTLLLALAAVRRAYDPSPAWSEPELRRAFLHAWMRATAMMAAAREVPGARVEPRRAFLAGLFADLGGVALVTELGVHRVAPREAVRFAAEQHAAASAWLGAEWHLPGECILAAAQHHAAAPLYRAEPLLVLLWACEEIVVATSGTTEPAALPHGVAAARLAGLSAGVRFDVERACRTARERLGGALGGVAPDAGLRVA